MRVASSSLLRAVRETQAPQRAARRAIAGVNMRAGSASNTSVGRTASPVSVSSPPVARFYSSSRIAAATVGAASAHAPVTEADKELASAQHGARTTTTTLEHIDSHKFADFKLSAGVQQAIDLEFKYQFCTDIQAEAIPPVLRGKDLLAKAKTGTGKTLSFLIPAISALENIDPRQRRDKISVLILSPTRELALQIAAECEILVSRQKVPMTVQCVVGGTNPSTDLRKFNERVPDVLIATPGRLNDHLQNNGLAARLGSVRFLILDEADRLLDMGFKPEIDKIISALPDKNTRQNLLFSATFPKNVAELSSRSLRADHQIVDTIGDEENTHAHVDQYLITSEHVVANLFHVLKEHIGSRPDDFKVMVFFTTARLTQFYAELFNRPEFGLKDNAGRRVEVLEMHSRKSQSQRTRISAQFREKGTQICFSSDVSARGMDYPDVSLVVQLGMASDREQYIHRLGRTARAGKSGGGVLILNPFEMPFARRKLADLPLVAPPAELVPTKHWVDDFVKSAVAPSLAALPYVTKSMAYQTWLGFYNSHLKTVSWSHQELVDNANAWAASPAGLNMPQPPALLKKTIGKMGLRNTTGLRIESEDHKAQRPKSSAGSSSRQAPSKPRNPELRDFSSHPLRTTSSSRQNGSAQRPRSSSSSSSSSSPPRKR